MWWTFNSLSTSAGNNFGKADKMNKYALVCAAFKMTEKQLCEVIRDKSLRKLYIYLSNHIIPQQITNTNRPINIS